MAIIKSPVRDYNGFSASLVFIDGQAETEDKRLIEWFKEQGYEVIEEKRVKKKSDA
ncbi:hypothetical protein [Bacillus sp. BP-3]|uniref:hypothetical protein n=1 Tax=Bacillus sp. BP-3 TaxID=3022773 RepID=UPI00232D3A19|nr:hypothetical protein [Bacillus sp. BP-3]MDC2867567.1 hypothetical protein [Bacillus sp. BP-3]